MRRAAIPVSASWEGRGELEGRTGAARFELLGVQTERRGFRRGRLMSSVGRLISVPTRERKARKGIGKQDEVLTICASSVVRPGVDRWDGRGGDAFIPGE